MDNWFICGARNIAGLRRFASRETGIVARCLETRQCRIMAIPEHRHFSCFYLARRPALTRHPNSTMNKQYPAQSVSRRPRCFSKPGSRRFPARPRRILVVDDEPAARVLANRVFSEAGFEVVTVQSGFECLERFRKQPHGFDLILLDLSMPFMDGEETFRRLRAINPGRRRAAQHRASWPRSGWIECSPPAWPASSASRIGPTNCSRRSRRFSKTSRCRAPVAPPAT